MRHRNHKVRWQILVTVALCLLYGVVLGYFHTQQFRPERVVLGQYVSDCYAHLEETLRGTGYSLNTVLLRASYKIGGGTGCGLLFAAVDICGVIAAALLLRKFVPGLSQLAAMIAAMAACGVMAWRLPGTGMTYFLGTIMGTIYHNITYAEMKPFALLALYYFFDLWEQRREKLSWRCWGLFTICLTAATAFKPSFAVCFSPVLLVLLIVDLVETRGSNIFNEFALGCTVLPSVGECLWQSMVLFGGEEGGVEFAPLVELTYWTDLAGEPFWLCVLRSLAFPLAVLLCYGMQHWREVPYRFSWFLFGSAFAQTALLLDSARPTHGNFRWGSYFAVLVLFLTALAVLLRELRAAWPRLNAKLFVCSGLFLWQVAAGLWYFRLLFSGGDYTI